MSTMFKIFIGNVNFRTTEEQLRRPLEAQNIVIEELIIAQDEKTGKPAGYAFALTRDVEAGRKALRRVGKVYIDGRLVYFKEAHGKKFKGGRKGGRGGGFGRSRPSVTVRNIRRRSTGGSESGGGGGGNRGGGSTGGSGGAAS